MSITWSTFFICTFPKFNGHTKICSLTMKYMKLNATTDRRISSSEEGGNSIPTTSLQHCESLTELLQSSSERTAALEAQQVSLLNCWHGVAQGAQLS